MGEETETVTHRHSLANNMGRGGAKSTKDIHSSFIQYSV